MHSPFPDAIRTLCRRCLDAAHELTGVPHTNTLTDDCRVFADLDEHADIQFHAATTAGPTAGDRNSHVDELRSKSGRTVGTITGTGWKLFERADGHVMSYYREEIELDNGTVHTCGWMDSTAVWAGSWQTLHAVGTSGDLLGLVGVRQIKQVRPRELFTANLLLCAVPSRS